VDGDCQVFATIRWVLLPCLLLADRLIFRIFHHTQLKEYLLNGYQFYLAISQQLSDSLKELHRGAFLCCFLYTFGFPSGCPIAFQSIFFPAAISKNMALYIHFI
jgi:hypothetical protein